MTRTIKCMLITRPTCDFCCRHALLSLFSSSLQMRSPFRQQSTDAESLSAAVYGCRVLVGSSLRMQSPFRQQSTDAESTCCWLGHDHLLSKSVRDVQTHRRVRLALR
ncbi:hypothetical protein PMIN07_005585 [Paraphaeosphaeria minitans]